MGDALSSAVTGLKAHQKMIDVAGNNLANVNTTGFKASRVTFAELLSETAKKASGPTSVIGGTNPQQIGSGVGISSVSRNMGQGAIVATGNELDMAISGEGYFVLNNGTEDIYSRIGAFSIDANGTLVDASTGYRVQRIGTIGESDGFQTVGDASINIPFDVALPANATTEIQLTGNLRATAMDADKAANAITASSAFSTTTGYATASDTVIGLEQFTAGTGGDPGGFGVGESGTIRITGTMPDGSTAVNTTFTIDGSSTVQDILDGIGTAFGGEVAATLSEGSIVITDTTAGYSRTVVSAITYETASSGGENLTFPSYCKLSTAGGEDSQSVSIGVYDELGGQHILRGSFVRSDTTNTWDMVIMSVDGEVGDPGTTDRRIEGIQFNEDGSFNGLAGSGETKTVEIRFAHAPTTTQTLSFTMGSESAFDGLTQFAAEEGKTSTAAANRQDGYSSGSLSSLSVNNEAKVVGTFSNGIKKDIAAISLALFQNAEGLESAGNGYFISTENSGEAIETMALNGGAGTVIGRSLEKSNVDTASEFVSLMQAQNGFQANARTITVANDILRELTNLIR